MGHDPLPSPQFDGLDSVAYEQYRKGYRSFRRNGSEHARLAKLGAEAGSSHVPVPIPSVASRMRPIECQADLPPPIQSSRSDVMLQLRAKAQANEYRRDLGLLTGDNDEDEPHLAASPFRLRPCCRWTRERPSSHTLATDVQLGDAPSAKSRFDGRAGSVKPSKRANERGEYPSIETQPDAIFPAKAAKAQSQGSSRRNTILFIAVWYFTGAFTNSSSKQALASLPSSLPLTLTAVQHLAASLCGTLVYRLLQLQPYKPLPAYHEVSAQARSALFWLCLVYSLGFSLTNASFGAVNASFVDTVKAAEPISTVALAALFLSNEKMTPRVLLALLPIVGGVGISSMAEASASLIGLAFALGSNLCFSARSIAAKLVGKHMGAARMDGANLFVHVNILGLMALVPAALLLEGRQLAELASSLPDEQLVASARLFAFNGLMYYLNNQMNFIVLEQVDTLTHGIINCGRRVANILFAIMWFGNKVTVFNGAGISLAIAGGFLYVRAKVLDAKREKEAKKRAGRKSE